MTPLHRFSVRRQARSAAEAGPTSSRRALELALVAVFVGLATVGCEQLPTDRPSTDASATLSSENGWGIEHEKEVALQDAGLTELYELAVAPDGRLAAVDRGDHDVHLFSPEGNSLAVVGADDQYGETMDATFTPDGQQLVVATLGDPINHIHVFETGQSDGGTASHVRSFPLPGMLYALKVEAVGDDRIVVINHHQDPLKERLGLYDLEGNLIRRFHPSRGAYYRVPYWESTTERLLTTDGEQIAAGGNLLYPFARYDAQGNRTGAVGASPSRWDGPPEPPEGAFTGENARREFEKWRRTFTTISEIAFTDDGVFAVATEKLDPDVLSHDQGSYTLDLYQGTEPVLVGRSLPGALLEGGEHLWVLDGPGVSDDGGTWTLHAYRVTSP